MEWFEIRVEIPADRKEAVSNRLFELGARGVSDTEAAGLARLVGYFDGHSAAGALVELKTYLASLAQLFGSKPYAEPQLAPVVDADWVELHKEFYKAQKLSSRFFLRPAWDKTTPVPDGMTPIVMDLGQAFGTGLHPSTQLAIHLMERVVDGLADPAAARLVDVGTGTGILAIVGEKLGMRKIEAMDVDPIAEEAAADNVKLNGCKAIRLFTGELKAVKGPVDFIVSNILLEVHVGLVETYRKLLKPGGWIVLSGLLTPQLSEVEELFSKSGFRREESQSNQEWSAVTYRREP